MQVLLAHPGTQHAPRLARELERLGLLGSFWTGLAIADTGPTATLVRRLRGLPFSGPMAGRLLTGVPAERLHCQPWNEMRALLRLRRGAEERSVLHERNARFQEAIPDSALQASDAVIAFDTSAWQLAARARGFGRPLYLDRSIAHPAAFARIEGELHRRYPDWCPAPASRPDDLIAAEAEEHQLAHRIVVGGSYAQATLLAEGIPAAKVRINPYGVDWTRFALPPAPKGDHPLRFLFLGAHLARKGLPVLLEAWAALGGDRAGAELWLVGYCGARQRRLIPPLPGLRVVGPVPHAELPAVLAQADVFVLPSYVEGFGLVLLEALAAGLPFIATPHTGAADFPADPALGRLVPPGSVEALTEALRHYVANPPERAAVRLAASALSGQYSWPAYGGRWAALLQEN